MFWRIQRRSSIAVNICIHSITDTVKHLCRRLPLYTYLFGGLKQKYETYNQLIQCRFNCNENEMLSNIPSVQQDVLYDHIIYNVDVTGEVFACLIRIYLISNSHVCVCLHVKFSIDLYLNICTLPHYSVVHTYEYIFVR